MIKIQNLNIFFSYFWIKVQFNPIGNLVLTASADKTARVWFTETGICSQVLSGHTDEVISCAFNYPGSEILLDAIFFNLLSVFSR